MGGKREGKRTEGEEEAGRGVYGWLVCRTHFFLGAVLFIYVCTPPSSPRQTPACVLSRVSRHQGPCSSTQHHTTNRSPCVGRVVGRGVFCSHITGFSLVFQLTLLFFTPSPSSMHNPIPSSTQSARKLLSSLSRIQARKLELLQQNACT